MRERTKEKKRRKAVSRAPRGLVKITSPVRPDVSFFVASDLADDKLIEQEISGEVVKTMIYEFENDGKTVRGLSKNGVDEVVRRINKNPASGSKIRISPEPPTITRDVTQDGQKGIEIMVYAEDLVSGGGAWGAKFEPYTKVGRKGTYNNTFAFEKALSKAQRNAKRMLIPEQLAIAVIAKLAKVPGAVQVIEAPKTITRETAPQPTNPAKLYEATIARISQIAKDKKKLNQALDAVDNMPFDKAQKEQVKNIILDCLQEL